MKTYDYNLVKELSTLSTIPEKTLNKLTDKVTYCVCDSVAEAMSENEYDDKSIDIDIGIGKLSIGYVDDNVVYKFIPSESLDASVKQAVLNGRNLLEDTLEKSFIDKVTNVYKDLV